MKRVVHIGDTFELRRGRDVDTFRREPDDEAPMFECERMRVTHLTSSRRAAHDPYTFGAEPQWFAERGLVTAKGGE
ncbi:MAG TPA: hypothetical protein VIY73_24625 [Polyangiaceae bacterium]